MRLLALACCVALLAASAAGGEDEREGLSPSTLRILDTLDRDVARAEAAYSAALERARDTALRALEREEARIVRSGDLDAALAIRTAIERVRTIAGGEDAGPEAVDARNLPRTITLNLGGGVPLRMVLIPAGKFTMGSPDDEKDRQGHEGPQREVTLTKPFYMGIFSVTQAQYDRVMGNNPSRFKGPTHPVESVTWFEAVEFCRRLSATTNKTFRLPTEAEWEYAARAGTTTRFSYGDDPDYVNLKDYAWYDDNSDGRTQPVGQKRPNAFGLYDMHGNVWEWCSDYFGSYRDLPAKDPTGPDNGRTRLYRGGSCVNAPGHSRSARRHSFDPDHRFYTRGFRIVMEPF